MNIAHILPRSSIYGPGERFVIWTQGCSIRCPGCWNIDTWSNRPRRVMAPQALAAQVIAARSAIDGVTILGGEPLDQYDDLYALLILLKAQGIHVMLYSGRSLEAIQAMDKAGLLRLVDILVDGPYIDAQRDANLRWRGSHNQNVHYLGSDTPDGQPEASEIEVIISEDGSMWIHGYPDALWEESSQQSPAASSP